MLHARIIERIRAEYLEMPGLRLSATQAERLCGVELTLCKAVLDALVDAKFLTVTAAGLYARTSDGAPASIDEVLNHADVVESVNLYDHTQAGGSSRKPPAGAV